MQAIAFSALLTMWTTGEAAEFFNPLLPQTLPNDWRDYLNPDSFNKSAFIFGVDSPTDVAAPRPQDGLSSTPATRHQSKTKTHSARPRRTTTAATSERPMASQGGNTQTYILRLGPGMEICSALQQYAEDNKLQAAFVVTAVGSVSRATLRAGFHETKQTVTLTGPREIVSLVGTISAGGHLHSSLSDKDGAVVGGHVVGDMIVADTCEVVLGNTQGVKMTRPVDPDTGRPQLNVEFL